MKNNSYLFMFTLFLLSITHIVNAQKRIKLNPTEIIGDGLKVSTLVTSKADTLSYNEIITNYNTIFNLEGQDIVAAWFICPLDLTVKSVGIDCGENAFSVSSEIKIVKVNKAWTKEKLQIQGSENLGYWINGFNPNVVLPYAQDAADPKQWISNTIGSTFPFEEDLWSDNGQGALITLQADGDSKSYQWIEMDQLNVEPTLKKGEGFAICIKNTEPKESDKTLGIMATNETGYGVLKYYAKGRIPGNLTTTGWWKREYLVNVAVAVEITGDAPPSISDIEILPTTLSMGTREVTAKIVDQNPGGGLTGVRNAYVQYFINKDTTWKDITMTKSIGDIYTGTLPAQQAGAKVTYRIKATDVNGNIATSNEWYSYYVYVPTPGVNSLLVFNGMNADELNYYPLANYFEMRDVGKVYTWPHDTWAYGALTTELVNNYSNIFELTDGTNSGAEIVYNDVIIKKWLEESSNRNYALAGQEWLGARSGFIDKDYEIGSFENDILGITHSCNDVSDINSTTKPSRVFAKQGSLLGDELYNKFTLWGTDSLQYDPYYELNQTENWIDGFEVISDQIVDMVVEARFLNGIETKQNVAVLTHRILSNGNKVAFFGYDPIALNTCPPATNAKYFKFGSSISSPQVKVLNWFNVLTDIKEESLQSSFSEFQLFQNYPNPFNPKTKITYSLPAEGFVSLKIFDVLGREIASLVDEHKKAGIYEAIFDGSQLASGVYLYRLSTSEYTSAKKLILLK